MQCIQKHTSVFKKGIEIFFLFFWGGGSLEFLSERSNTAKKLCAMQLHIVDFKVDNNQ